MWPCIIVGVTNQPSVSDWVVQVHLWPSDLGVGLWNQRPGFDPRTVRYTGGSGNPGSPVSGSSPPWLKVALARGLGFQKGGSNVTNQPSVSDWVVQVPLWPSGLDVGLWNRRPGFDPCTVRYSRNWPRFCLRSHGWTRHHARVGSSVAPRVLTAKTWSISILLRSFRS